MKHKAADLEGALLDAAVAKAEGYELDEDGYNLGVRESTGAPTEWRPSSCWSQGGPIIEREQIATVPMTDEADRATWFAYVTGAGVAPGHYIDTYPSAADGDGPTPLIAAMRAYVASKLGDEVELP